MHAKILSLLGLLFVTFLQAGQASAVINQAQMQQRLAKLEKSLVSLRAQARQLDYADRQQLSALLEEELTAIANELKALRHLVIGPKVEDPRKSLARILRDTLDHLGKLQQLSQDATNRKSSQWRPYRLSMEAELAAMEKNLEEVSDFFR